MVWCLARRFCQPQKYKPFVSRCVVQGELEIGSLREVDVKSGLPATTSTERLELLDDDEHVLSDTIIGGEEITGSEEEEEEEEEEEDLPPTPVLLPASNSQLKEEFVTSL